MHDNSVVFDQKCLAGAGRQDLFNETNIDHVEAKISNTKNWRKILKRSLRDENRECGLELM